MNKNKIVVVRGGGDIATGVISALWWAGYKPLVLECQKPSAIRRTVSLCEAVYQGEATVEDITCKLCTSYKEALQLFYEDKIPVIVDPDCKILNNFKPFALVDAIIAKKNYGTNRAMAEITVALGPGFNAGEDVDIVVETMRGHNLGKLIENGWAMPNTATPGEIKGVGIERVIHATEQGKVYGIKKITDIVVKGEKIAEIHTSNGEIVDVNASINGVIRGLIRDEYYVTKGFKIADIDPREDEVENCFTISDKARAIGGSVVVAIGKQDRKNKENSKIYLDNAATTITKPQEVAIAVTDALSTFGNEGRGAGDASLKASRGVYGVREKISNFFGASGGEDVAFTNNATTALNMGIMGILQEGDTVVSTIMEHNSVLRPLYKAEKELGVNLEFIGIKSDGSLDIDALKLALEKKPKLMVCTHVSNLTGAINNIEYIGKLCRDNGVIFMVDASQSAGVLPISIKEFFIDILCFTGHKALFGPQGTGGIIVRKGINLKPLYTGGSGINTFEKTHPQVMPNALEAGTLNSHSIAGLGAAIDFLNTVNITNIKLHEQNLRQLFLKLLTDIKSIKIYSNNLENNNFSGVVALNIGDINSQTVGDILDRKFNITVRTGGHCAPLMHMHLGTKEQGLVRFSFSYFTKESDVISAVNAIKTIAWEYENEGLE